MANEKISITDAATGETIERLMTNDEQSAHNAYIAGLQAEAEAKAAEAEQAATDKAALLAKLGITADEAKLLLS